MAEIYKNTSQFEYLDIANGTADAPPTVVLKISGQPDETLTPTHITTGLPSGITDRWRVYVQLVHTVVEQDFTIQWNVTVGGEPIQKIDYFTVITPYITPEEIARREGWTFGVDVEKSDVVIAERLARSTIDRLIPGGFGSRSRTVTVYGQDADLLYLNRNILSVTSLYEDGDAVITNNENTFGYSVEITESSKAIRIISNGVNIYESEHPDAVYRYGQFKNGSRYDVTGIFGYVYVPENIRDAAWLLAKSYLCPDATMRNKYVLSMSTQNNDVEFSPMVWWSTGNAMADSLLDPYRIPPILVI